MSEAAQDFETRDWRAEHRDRSADDIGYISSSARLYKGDVWLADIEVWHGPERNAVRWKIKRCADPAIIPISQPFLDERADSQAALMRRQDYAYAAAVENDRKTKAAAALAALGMISERDRDE